MTPTSTCRLRVASGVAVMALALTACNQASAPVADVNNTELVGFVQASQANIDPYATIYALKGAAYRTVVDHSHYTTPILQNGQPRGNSRIWGDASIDVQRASIEAIRDAAQSAGMNIDQEAMVLAIAYVESGFNPDAAAGTTSAQGLGQFIRSTGAAYGLTDANRWDVNEQARALVAHTLDNYEAAQVAGLSEEYVYARHHDGSFSNNYGGVDLALNRVLPRFQEIRALLEFFE